MTVRLRLHHLLCMLTFIGEGYDPAFTENYRSIARRLTEGEDILLVFGPDDICAPLLDGPDAHCLLASVDIRDNAAAASISALLGRKVGAGSTLLPDAALLAALRTAFAEGTIRQACSGCEWDGLCSRIASGCYSGILVDPAS
ncbi:MULTISPECIES: DUF1284 domain-containing protein [unclassified Rhizobium]|uniref:DUF1284 domain-containing protein n=1 Tax=unclassified Rhizobium TaxID=2613769 RepID=UPI001ADBFFE0|nr:MULTISPECIES: DUF1284 domain-containing protein [unclassified Rhizobium]MBO9097539.1 DUF1284 domain-containing protein [Rhizobium sp. L58/93]MBO9167778.1 DUF1284 domain-containing protein [Rhizobium sp. L245/93]MBO9183737.1 DUF1284 domain-containing protein [Rhizobium sp. E27B/91]QXZ84052.1 DUF1284 domain-containing protein [Rhizobium sp. K1/93]QXZ88436.1 DUF1284 domain-containing protein [Rhizobium sp. K15/93]